MLNLFKYYMSMFITVSIFSYVIMGKKIINTLGSHFGGVATVGYGDFFFFCFTETAIPILLGAGFFLLFNISKFIILRFLSYSIAWLISATLIASSGAVNWGATWKLSEVFWFFLMGNMTILLALILSGFLVCEISIKSLK